jgi:hypothetical protein
MKKFGSAAAAAAGLAVAIVGLAAPAQAFFSAAPVSGITFTQGIDHETWLDDITQQPSAPSVDTTVHQSR